MSAARYEEVGRKRADLVCWGSLNTGYSTSGTTPRRPSMPEDVFFVSPGAIRDGQLLTDGPGDDHLGIRIASFALNPQDWKTVIL